MVMNTVFRNMLEKYSAQIAVAIAVFNRDLTDFFSNLAVVEKNTLKLTWTQ